MNISVAKTNTSNALSSSLGRTDVYSLNIDAPENFTQAIAANLNLKNAAGSASIALGNDDPIYDKILRMAYKQINHGQPFGVTEFARWMVNNENRSPLYLYLDAKNPDRDYVYHRDFDILSGVYRNALAKSYEEPAGFGVARGYKWNNGTDYVLVAENEESGTRTRLPAIDYATVQVPLMDGTLIDGRLFKDGLVDLNEWLKYMKNNY